MRSEHDNFMFEHFARGDYDGCISHSVKGWIGEIRKMWFFLLFIIAGDLESDEMWTQFAERIIAVETVAQLVSTVQGRVHRG